MLKKTADLVLGGTPNRQTDTDMKNTITDGGTQKCIDGLDWILLRRQVLLEHLAVLNCQK